MASGPITSWQIDGETVADFIFGGSKITEDGDCSHEIKRHSLLLGRKLWQSILKSRGITLLTKVCLVKAVVFPVVRYRCESWTIKKAECQRIDAFELWCWIRLLKVSDFEWTLGDGDGQGRLACCDSWGHKELDTTERLNWTEVMYPLCSLSEELFLFFPP